MRGGGELFDSDASSLVFSFYSNVDIIIFCSLHSVGKWEGERTGTIFLSRIQVSTPHLFFLVRPLKLCLSHTLVSIYDASAYGIIELGVASMSIPRSNPHQQSSVAISNTDTKSTTTNST